MAANGDAPRDDANGRPTGRHLPTTPLAILALLDLAAIAAALAAAVAVGPSIETLAAGRLASHSEQAGVLLALLLLQALAIPFSLGMLGQYRMAQDPERSWSFPRLLLVLVAVQGFYVVLLRVLQGEAPPGAVLVADFVLLVALLAGWRELASRRTRARVLSGQWVTNALLVGEGPVLAALARQIVEHPLGGRRILGFVAPGAPEPAPAISDVWAPGAADLAAVVRENTLRQPRHLWVALPDGASNHRQGLVDALGAEELFLDSRLPPADVADWIRIGQARGLDVHVVPRLAELGITPRPWLVGPVVVMDIHRTPISRLGALAKRALDVVGASVGLVVALPVVLVTAAAIKLDSWKLPVLYRSTRVGLKGRRYEMEKFTTMRQDAQVIEADLLGRNQREGPWFKVDAHDDPRLTRSGRWIRRLSINEIPQFWNVLKGDMSLVGPRPPLPSEVATYLDYDVRYFQCLDVRPGITGLWQVTARDDPSFDRRIELDLQYIRTWTIWLDLKILLLTVRTVLFKPEE